MKNAHIRRECITIFKIIQGFHYIKPLAEEASPKEAYVHSQLIKHQRWSAALAMDRQMSAEFGEHLKVLSHFSKTLCA